MQIENWVGSRDGTTEGDAEAEEKRAAALSRIRSASFIPEWQIKDGCHFRLKTGRYSKRMEATIMVSTPKDSPPCYGAMSFSCLQKGREKNSMMIVNQNTNFTQPTLHH
jgi:hypothetical protein